MKEALLNNLFPLITSLRKAGMKQLSEGNYSEAENIRKLYNQLSDLRDKIITAQFTEISKKNEESLLLLSKINVNLNNYLSLKEKADSKLALVLNSLPALLSLLNSLIK